MHIHVREPPTPTGTGTSSRTQFGKMVLHPARQRRLRQSMKRAKLSLPRLIKTDHALCFGLEKCHKTFCLQPHISFCRLSPTPVKNEKHLREYLQGNRHCSADHQPGPKPEAATQNMKRDASWPTIGMDAKGDCVEVSSICSCALTL